MTKHNSKRTPITTLCVLLVLIIATGVIGVFAFPSVAYVAGNTGVHTLYGTESTFHDALLMGTDYSETPYCNTGIQIYSSANNGMSTSGNSVKIDTDTFYVDFGNCNVYYPPNIARADKNYNFEILNSSGIIVWYAQFTGSSTTNDKDVTTYKKVININGSSTTRSGQDQSLVQFNPADFGRRSVSLSSGNYSIRITREYEWKRGNNIFKDFYYSNSTLTGSLLVDYTKPTLTMHGYSTGNNVTSGSYVKERVTFTASDTNFYRLYYKTPSSSAYTYTTSRTYTTGTANGWYYGYAQDSVGNKTDTFSFYYDSSAPSGRILSGGTTVDSGAYIAKSFSYSATDSGSGIAAYYYKTPTTGSYLPYSAGTIIPASAGDGWYYFYSVDRSGNQSSILSVYLETQAPLVEIYRNGTLSYSKSMTTSGSYDTWLYLRPNDILRISCDTSSGKVTSNYALDTNHIIGSNYPNSSYTITITSATGITSNFKYAIVREKPSFTIGNKTYNDGETVYLNTDTLVSWNCSSIISDTADTGVSILSEGNVNLNEFLRYKDGKSKTLTTAAGTDTKYVLTQTDRAGNTGMLTVYIDKSAPSGVWETEGKKLESNGYTNKPLSFVFEDTDVTATYSFNGSEYQSYRSGQTFTADGTYTVVLTDRALNKSTFTAHIDTVAPTGQLYADYSPVPDGTITNGKIYFSWDGDITATFNGKPYVKNTVLSSDANYTFVLTDFAGNTTAYTITVDTMAPSYNANALNGSNQMISKWYIVTVGGKDYSFATYDEAIAYACEYEFANAVTVLHLDSADRFNQHHLVADNGSADNTDDEVRAGEYWLYKSKAIPDNLLYYFDRKLLNEVISRYAKEYISPVNYFELDGKNEYGIPSESMNDNILTAPDGTSAHVLNGYVFERADSTELYAELIGGDGTKIKVEFAIPFGQQFSMGGLYKLTELDAAGNQTVYYGFLDVLAPELNVSATIFGNTEPTELTINKDILTGIAAYYYESFDIKAIADADKWAVLTVTNGGNTAFYTYGDKLPVINIGGEYLLALYDRSGNSYSFTVYIVGSPADIAFKNNKDDTAFDVKITLEQNFDTLVSLEIRRNGVLIEGVSTDMLAYTFDKGGVYTVTLRDNFGRVIEKEYTFIKSLPSGTLSGVENGGKTKNDVTFTFDSGKYFVVVTKDGKVMDFASNGKLLFTANNMSSGEYFIRLVNLTDEENYSEYAFIINTLAPDFALSVTEGTTTNKDVTVSWKADDIVSVTYTVNGGEQFALENGQAITAEGYYVVIAINDLGTTNEMTFTIDKTLNYYVMVGEQIASVDRTSETVAVFSNENLYVSVTKNGAPMDYAFGVILSDEAVYAFRISADYGNAVTFTMTIDKSVSYSANVGKGVISNGGVSFVSGEKLTVTVTKDKEVIDYAFGQILDDEGEYKVVLRDNYGNERTVQFRIVKGVKRSIDYTLGENVKVLSVTLGGKNIAFEGSRLNFTADGEYTVTARADGEVYIFTLALDSTAPTVVLSGVENGGTADGIVTITEPSEEVTIEVYFNGDLIPYELGAELIEYGDYRIVVTDAIGNISEYSFTLKHLLNGGAVALVVIGIFILAGLLITIILLRKKGKFGKNKPMKKHSLDKTETESDES